MEFRVTQLSERWGVVFDTTNGPSSATLFDGLEDVFDYIRMTVQGPALTKAEPGPGPVTVDALRREVRELQARYERQERLVQRIDQLVTGLFARFRDISNAALGGVEE